MGPVEPVLRLASLADGPELLDLWAGLFEGDAGGWRAAASAWLAGAVGDPSVHLPVVERDGRLVATAVGTLELGVPNPYSPRGRLVRLANLLTLPTYRGQGLGTALVAGVVTWARSVDADRVDLSATPAGQRLYARAGFVPTTAPRMKLVL